MDTYEWCIKCETQSAEVRRAKNGDTIHACTHCGYKRAVED